MSVIPPCSGAVENLPERLSDWPWVVVRVSCKVCPRSGQCRLARLADRFGADYDLEKLLHNLSFDCPYRRPKAMKPRSYEADCGVRFTDLDAYRPLPPDVPPALIVPKLRLVKT